MNQHDQGEASDTSTEIVGVMRLSYLSEGGYQRAYKNLEEQKAFLYDKGRLSRCISLFENLALPSLRAQTNQNFRMILLTGEALPQWAEEHILQAIDGTALELVKKAPTRMRLAVSAAYEESFTGKADIEVTFPMDDDDAVSMYFIEKLHQAIPVARSVLEFSPELAYFMKKGFMLNLASKEPAIDAVKLDAPLSLAMAIFRKRGHKVDPHVHAHYNIVNQMYSMSDVDKFGFIRSIHDDCDIRHGDNNPFSRAHKINKDIMKNLEVFFTEFGINEENLEEVFRVINERVSA